MKKFLLLITLLITATLSFGQNLIMNSDFETNELSPHWGGFNNQIVTDDITSSLVGNANNAEASIFQVIDVTPGETYDIEFDYRWVSGTTNYNCNIRIKDANNLPNNLDLIGGTTDNGYKLKDTADVWYDGSFSFIPPAGVTSIRLLFYKGNNNRPLRIDNVSLTLNVPCSNPVSDFIISDTTFLQLGFTNQSTVTGTASYLWTFGNGESSTEESPMYTYDTAGTYMVCLEITDDCGTASVCETITVAAMPTSIESLSQHDLSIYPNPASDFINLSAEENIDRIEIYNMLGQQVLSKYINSNNTQVDINRLPTGNYIITSYIGESITSYKLNKH